MVKIKFENLEAVIDTKGAQLRSLKKDGKELLWQGDAEWWENTAPVLFPICSNLKNGVYNFEDKQYSMPSHGFANALTFDVKQISENSALLSATSNPKTLEMYPFEFEFSVSFTLEKDKLITKYITTNPSDKDMYYSVGSHEGYDCPEGVENYAVLFNKEEQFDSCVLDGPILTYEKENVAPNGKRIDLKSEHFTVDAIILEHINSDEISLLNKTTGDIVKVELADFENLLIWSIPGAPFVCLECWCGFPDFVDTNGDFTKKHSIIKLAPGKTDTKTHIINI